jgi:hypothetical protein
MTDALVIAFPVIVLDVLIEGKPERYLGRGLINVYQMEEATGSGSSVRLNWQHLFCKRASTA